MSAKLMKSLASGSCTVYNPTSGQVRVYWEENGSTRFTDVDSKTAVDLHLVIPIESLRKSRSLKDRIHSGQLMVR